MDDPVCSKYSKWNISLWDDFTMGKPKRSWKKEYLLILGIFWSFLRLCGIPQGPQGSPRWKTVCLEKLRLNILLWDDFTWKKCVLLTLKVDKWQRKMIWDMLWPFSSSEGPPKAPWRAPIVPNGQPSVSWKFEKRYFTLRRFHYGNTRWHLHGKWTKDCLMIWGIF